MSDLQVRPEVQAIFEVEQKKDSLIAAFTNDGIVDELFVMAPDNIKNWPDEKKEQFVRGTVLAVAEDENLKDCFKSPHGKRSIFKAVKKACSTGLEVGGRHAYLVPQNRNIGTRDNKQWVCESRFSIKASGYVALLCGGEKPIFEWLKWGIVREGDDCKIDSGDVHFVPAITAEVKPMIGIWVQCKWKGRNEKDAKFFPKQKIDQWKKSAQTQNVWDTWPDEMAEQAAIRHFCDKYEQARELLSEAIYEDAEEVGEVDTIQECENALNGALSEEQPDIDMDIEAEEEKHLTNDEQNLDLF